MKKEDIYKGLNVFLIAVSIIRVLLQFKLPLSINVDQTADDGLLQNLALNLYNGDYLGKYDYLTLCKNSFYSYILAFCYKTMIPYTVLLSAFNIGSAYAICRAVKKQFSKISRSIIFVVLIYMPYTFSNLTALRVYRNSVLPYFVLFVFAGFIALYLRKDEDRRKWISWVVLECICFPCFWYLKEDSIWILPFCLVISILSLVWIFIHDRKVIVEKAICFLLPFMSLCIVTVAIMLVNYEYYGIATVNDRSKTEAGKFYSNLIAIDGAGGENSSVWVDNQTLQSVAKISPTFSGIYNEMKKSDAFLTDGEMQGDYYIWKIRFTMNDMGYYETATKANEIYAKMNDEVEEAFESGDLKKDNLIHLSSQMRGLTMEGILGFIPKAISNMGHMSTYKNLEYNNLGSHGDVIRLETQQYLLGNNTFKEHTTEYQEEAKEYQLHLCSHVNVLILIYQKLSKHMDVLAIICFVLYISNMLYNMLKRKIYGQFDLFIILSGIILSAFLVALEVELFMSWFDDEMYSSFVEFYSVSEYPLISVFKYFSIAAICELVYKSKPIIKNS